MVLDSAEDWEKWGKAEPYYAVCTSPEFKSAEITEEGKARFFQTGYDQIEDLFAFIETHFRCEFRPRTSLDFGCGVGRILIPLSQRSETVVGVDVSQAMLDEAKRNCDANGITNVQLVKGDDRLGSLTSPFDFVHSFIVFQHIPPKKGLVLLDRLIELLAVGGMGAIHLTFADELPLRTKVGCWLRKSIPFYHNFSNIREGKPWGDPLMQMNNYDLGDVCLTLNRRGCTRFCGWLATHGTAIGAFLVFRRDQPEKTAPPAGPKRVEPAPPIRQ